MSVSTPWGISQTKSQIAAGIVFYSTAGHGGFHLDEPRFIQLKRTLPSWVSFGGWEGWFEEDCDAAVIPIVFSHCFQEMEIYNAIRSARLSLSWSDGAGKWKEVVDYIEISGLDAIEQAMKDKLSNMWERGSMFCGTLKKELSSNWVVAMRRNNEIRHYVMPYPAKQFYSDDDLAEYEIFDEEKHSKPTKKMNFWTEAEVAEMETLSKGFN